MANLKLFFLKLSNSQSFVSPILSTMNFDRQSLSDFPIADLRAFSVNIRLLKNRLGRFAGPSNMISRSQKASNISRFIVLWQIGRLFKKIGENYSSSTSLLSLLFSLFSFWLKKFQGKVEKLRSWGAGLEQNIFSFFLLYFSFSFLSLPLSFPSLFSPFIFSYFSYFSRVSAFSRSMHVCPHPHVCEKCAKRGESKKHPVSACTA